MDKSLRKLRCHLVAAVVTVALQLSGAANALATPTQALWVFPSSSFANPVTDSTARQTLITNSAASRVNLLYVSVYSSSPNAAGRYMYNEAAIADLITRAHQSGMKVYAAYGAPDWPTFGCGGFPLARMQDVVSYNNDNPFAKFDGIVLDIEPPEPQSTAAYQALLSQYQCFRNALPSDLYLSAAIRFFWDQPVQYPAGTGTTKPVYAHIIDLNLRHVIVMGYRDFAGPADCTTDGIICLDQDEISYAAGIGKLDIILAGLETNDPATTGISNKETFYEEGQPSLNAQTQTVLDHFGILNGIAGFALHNYENTYLAGTTATWPTTNPAFPTDVHEVKIALTKQPTHYLLLQGVGIPNRTYHVQASANLSPATFQNLDSVTASATGVLNYTVVPPPSATRQFYRLSYP